MQGFARGERPPRSLQASARLHDPTNPSATQMIKDHSPNCERGRPVRPMPAGYLCGHPISRRLPVPTMALRHSAAESAAACPEGSFTPEWLEWHARRTASSQGTPSRPIHVLIEIESVTYPSR